MAPALLLNKYHCSWGVLMKLFVITFSLFFSFLSFPEEIDCHDCAGVAEMSSNCDLGHLKFLAEVNRESIFYNSKYNQPTLAVEAKQEYDELINRILACDSTIKCSDFSKDVKKPIKNGKGWREIERIDALYISSTKKCKTFPRLYIKKGDVSINASFINQSGILSFKLADVACMGKSDIESERQFYLSESGVLLVDDSEAADQKPGVRLFPKTLGTPQYKVTESGSLLFTTSDGAFFEISNGGGQVVKSDYLDPVMFDQKLCKTSLKKQKGKVRAYPQVIFKRGAKRKYVSGKMYVFGSASEAKERRESLVS